MKLQFLIFETKAPAWVNTARDDYAKKLGYFADFELKTLKSPSVDRGSATVKRRLEGELLLKHVGEKDLLILFDESGKLAKHSEEFAAQMSKALESGKTHLTFCIGGPYGFDESVKKRSQMRWSLSPLTMNHWIAQLMALEQLYRGFTLIKGIPYHNR